MLQASDCDASAEACTTPGSDDLNALTLGYLTEIILLVFSPVITLIFFSNTDAGLEILLLFLPSVIASYAYVVPFILSLIHIIFGSDFFLFSWVDNVLAFLIEHYLSNVQLIMPFAVYLTWVFVSDVDVTGTGGWLQEANDYHLATVLL